MVRVDLSGNYAEDVSMPSIKRAPRRRSAEIDIDEAKKAFFLMVGFIALIWVLQVVNWADQYQLDASYGILPHDLGRLPDIFTAPFLHFNWDHIEGNSGPLFIFGLLAAYRGVVRFLGVTLLVAVTSGMAVWLFQGSHELTVGASGLIFGYFGYVLVRGLFDRNLVDVIVGVLAGIAYAGILAVAIPGNPGISWIGHAGGLAGGVLAGWVLRSRRPAKPRAPQAPRVKTAPAPNLTSNPRATLHKELDDMGL